MIEFVSEAIVLDWENFREQDRRVFLYTKNFGKLTAKVTSARKSVSKLAAHLEPFNSAVVRLASKKEFFEAGDFQLTDALLIDGAKDLKSDADRLKEAIKIYNLLNKSIPDGTFDRQVWEFLVMIRKGQNSCKIADALRILGFDIVYAFCELCKKQKPEYFFPKDNFFVCDFCRVSCGNRNLVSIH